MDADKNKTNEQSPNQKTLALAKGWEKELNETENLGNGCSTPAKHHRKHCGPTIHVSYAKGEPRGPPSQSGYEALQHHSHLGV